MAQKHGFAITSTTINHLKAGTYKSRPSDMTIRALGWLAGVSEEAAFTAAGRPAPGPPLADELPDGVNNLSPKARQAVIDLLRVLVAAEESGGDAEAAPITRAGESPATEDVLVPDEPKTADDQAQLVRRARRALLQLDSIDLATAGTDKRAEYNAKHALSYSSRVLADVDPSHHLHNYPVYANMHSVPEEALEDDWTIESFHEGLSYALERLTSGEKGDELARRRRERGGLEVVPPRPDEDTMAAYDEPQQSILERDQQDADAEGSQVPPEED
ncbi:hypothetical protein E7Z53_07890 [Kocuria salina]|uniref:hypothetical protein n=1 Tax=Kocuria salina TaxID=1929416 RepID=UPI0015936C8D|nr:hypothetical protein [Kocuria salina]NVC23363.1 hypothetical protein [Kocuria salina]